MQKCDPMVAPKHVVLGVSTGHAGSQTLSNHGDAIEGNRNTCYVKVRVRLRLRVRVRLRVP